MPKRRAENDQWDLHRDVIIRLYVNEKRTLADVMQIMAARGFRRRYVYIIQGLRLSLMWRRKAQWERTLKKWAVAKNTAKEEWEFIVRRLSEREAENKISTVIVRGSVLSESKIKKQRRVHEYQTTFERCAKGEL